MSIISKNFNEISCGDSNKIKIRSNNHHICGIFTPFLYFGDKSIGINYSLQQGHYTKTGNTLTFTINISFVSKGNSIGYATILLPFYGRIGLINQNVLLSANDVIFSGFLIAGVSSNTLNLYDCNSVNGSLPLDQTNFTDTSQLFISGTILI